MTKRNLLIFVGGIAAVSALAAFIVYLRKHTSSDEVTEVPVEEPIDIQPESVFYSVDVDENEGDDGGLVYYKEPVIQKNYDIKPYEISQYTFAEAFPRFDKIYLHYEGTDENGEPVFVDTMTGETVEDIYQKVGAPNADRFLEIVGDDSLYVYVRNENTTTDYELFR